MALREQKARGSVTSVHYWAYNNGWSEIPVVFRKPDGRTREYNKHTVGWHCWVYPADDDVFVDWMGKNMQGEYSCIHRFNSGNPMYTVHIQDDEDATLFKLTWL